MVKFKNAKSELIEAVEVTTEDTVSCRSKLKVRVDYGEFRRR